MLPAPVADAAAVEVAAELREPAQPVPLPHGLQNEDVAAELGEQRAELRVRVEDLAPADRPCRRRAEIALASRRVRR